MHGRRWIVIGGLGVMVSACMNGETVAPPNVTTRYHECLEIVKGFEKPDDRLKALEECTHVSAGSAVRTVENNSYYNSMVRP